MPHDGESIVISSFPVYKEELSFKQEEKQMEIIMAAIAAVRNRRSEMNVPPSKKAKLVIVTSENGLFEKGIPFFEKLASASDVIVQKDKSGIDSNAVNVVVEAAEIFLPLGELVDKDKEAERLNKEKKQLEAEIKRVEGKLNNAGFVSKAPAHVVEEEKAKGEKYREMLDKVLESIKALENI